MDVRVQVVYRYAETRWFVKIPTIPSQFEIGVRSLSQPPTSTLELSEKHLGMPRGGGTSQVHHPQGAISQGKTLGDLFQEPKEVRAAGRQKT